MSEIPETKYARSGDLHIAYQVIGDGPIDIVTSPGWIRAALAGPGEVLASSIVKDLVVGSGIGFEARGSHTLKGVPDDWLLFAVRN
jgi:hypothetical protein